MSLQTWSVFFKGKFLNTEIFPKELSKEEVYTHLTKGGKYHPEIVLVKGSE
jgi:hypothetical protein